MRLEVVLSVIVVVVALAAAWWFRPAPEAAPTIEPTSTTTIPTQTVVHVSGEVVDPGLVRVSGGARVADAILAAGGSTPEADLTRINLAAPVVDGQQVIVPSINGPAQSATSDGRIRINDASAAELESLPRVGPVLAERIVAHRDAVGQFQTVEDLLDVPGIGEATLANMRELIVVP